MPRSTLVRFLSGTGTKEGDTEARSIHVLQEAPALSFSGQALTPDVLPRLTVLSKFSLIAPNRQAQPCLADCHARTTPATHSGKAAQKRRCPLKRAANTATRQQLPELPPPSNSLIRTIYAQAEALRYLPVV